MKRILALLAILVLTASAAYATPIQITDLSQWPETNEQGFLDEGADPVYYRNHQDGYWLYVDDTLRLEITRTQTTSPLMTYYLADIYLAPGSTMYTVSYNEENPGRTNGLPQDMAQKHNVVYAQNGDFYSYRVSHGNYPGNIVRDAKVLYNKSYSKMLYRVPNLATIGFFPSGKAEVNEAWEMSAKEYVERGATTVLAFGPLLMRDWETMDLSENAFSHKEPRSCFGIVETNHFVGLLVEGRKKHSDGATLAECAQILADFGCRDAINLDGGNTAAMLFMGESVQLSNNGGQDENDRAIPDILCAGSY